MDDDVEQDRERLLQLVEDAHALAQRILHETLAAAADAAQKIADELDAKAIIVLGPPALRAFAEELAARAAQERLEAEPPAGHA